MSTVEELQAQFSEFQETSMEIEAELQNEIKELTRQNDNLLKKCVVHFYCIVLCSD